MRTLFLDTSSSFLYVALIEDKTIVFSFSEKLGKDLSKLTINIIQSLFDNNNIKYNNIDKIIVVNGPGSFTGLRIGLTIAKTWAWTYNIPICTISTLTAMALSYNDSEIIVPVIDARHNYVYASIFDSKHNVILKEQYICLDNLKQSLSKYDTIKFISNDSFDFECFVYEPNYFAIIDYCKNLKTINPHLVDANYLKKTEAEEKLNDN